MRSFTWLLFTGLLPLGLALVACGRITTDPPSNDVLPTTGNACGTKGTTALAADGCNRCSCTEEGTWSCTELDCPADPSSCEEGDTKYADDGCNTCTCSED